MKRIIKKTLASILTLAIATASFSNMMIANAVNSDQLKTYRIYHEIKSNLNISYIDFSIQYSSNVLAEKSKATSLCNGGYFYSTNNISNRNIQSTYLGQPITKSGAVATTNFHVPMNTASIFNEITYNAAIRDNNNNNLDPNTISMNAVLVGDVNLDGEITIADVVRLNKYLLDSEGHPITEKGKLAADADEDGMLTASDSTLIQQYLAGLVDHF